MNTLLDPAAHHEIVAIYRGDDYHNSSKKSEVLRYRLKISAELIVETEKGFSLDKPIDNHLKEGIISDFCSKRPHLKPEKIEFWLHEFLEATDKEGNPATVTVWRFPIWTPTTAVDKMSTLEQVRKIKRLMNEFLGNNKEKNNGRTESNSEVGDSV